MSGSPLLNQRTGKVCGIVKFTRDRSIDLGGGAIPVAVILEQCPQLRALQAAFHQVDQRWNALIAQRSASQAVSQTNTVQVTQTVLKDVQAGGNITIGDINVTTVFPASPPPPEGIPSNLPHSGVVEFVGRAESMTQLHELLQQSERVAVTAIAGMGGIGKTELALQYALSYRSLYPGGLCWLQARTSDVGIQLLRFAQSSLNLRLPDGLEFADQLNYCWRNWPTGAVLLIFDDVTHYDAIISAFPPATESRFKLLITTRLKLGRSVQQLPLDVLDETAALNLLKSLAGQARIQSQQEEAQQLCEQLGYLPLGLELAGRYLDRRADLSVAELWQRLGQQQLAAKALCQTDADMTAKLGVAAAFQLSWDELSPAAQQLGGGLSLFAAAPIPWELVQACFTETDPEELEDWREELLKLHLLQRVAESTYRLHPLIREFLQSQLEQSAQAEEIKRQVCHALAKAAQQIPETLTREEIDKVIPLIPHLNHVATALAAWLGPEELIFPYQGLGRFYEGQGLYAEAEPWYCHCLDSTRTRFGAEHPDVATSLNNLAGSYHNQGRYSKAEPLYLQALELYQRLLEAENPLVAQSLNNLALLYKNQGRYSEAEPLYLQALALRQQLLGTEHPLVAQSLNNLAALYSNQRRYSEAEPLFQQALELYQRLLGAEHPLVAQSLNNLAALYSNQRRYSEAEPLFQQALKLRQQLLGTEHPDVATSLNNLARLYNDQGRYSEAEPLYLQALPIFVNILGDTHPNTQIVQNNFRRCLQQALEAGQAAQLSNHPTTQVILAQLQAEQP